MRKGPVDWDLCSRYTQAIAPQNRLALGEEGTVTEAVLQKNKNLALQYREVLSPAGYLVAVKMLKSLQGFEGVRKPARPRTLCQFLSQTRYTGRTVLVTAENVGCYAAGPFLGLGVDLPESAAKRYVGWQYANIEASQKTLDAVPKFERNSYKGMLITPLERCPDTPDVVLFFGNIAQILVGMNAYLRNRGGTLNFDASHYGTCAYAIVPPVKTGLPTMSFADNAWRLLAFPSETDLIYSIPGGLLEEIAESARQLRATGGTRYPVAWQHLDWDVQPPLGDLLKRDTAGPTWLKK